MAITTNVPEPTFGPTGFIAPAELDILNGALADLNEAFGGDMDPGLSTPQGQIASSLTACVGNANDTFLFYTQQVDPSYATGRMQDGIARIYFIERNPAQPTVVPGVCLGLTGTIIPAGSLVEDVLGNSYVSQAQGIIGPTGLVTIPFANVQTGPVPCAAGTLTTIVSAVSGWDTITNPTNGVLGNVVESRTDFEARRALSVAQNSMGSIAAVRGAVLSVSGVIDAFVTENTSTQPATIGGVTVLPKSLYVCAAGGAPADIAQAIFTRKGPGCGYNGTTTIQVPDTNPAYQPPYPTYAISYTVAVPLDIFVSVVIARSSLVPADATTQIQNAIISAFAGGDGGPRARIGQPLLASRYYAPIAALGTWAQIVSIQIGCINVPAARFGGVINGTTLTVSSVASGTLALGQNVDDASGLIFPGTAISAFGTGSGAAGTYTVSLPQMVSIEPMLAVTPNAFEVPVYINQIPTVAASNIVVALA